VRVCVRACVRAMVGCAGWRCERVGVWHTRAAGGSCGSCSSTAHTHTHTHTHTQAPHAPLQASRPICCAGRLPRRRRPGLRLALRPTCCRPPRCPGLRLAWHPTPVRRPARHL
jgi:hypothetical protein